jgi:pimeloyl-ACP methyl ester carboxylesterase
MLTGNLISGNMIHMSGKLTSITSSKRSDSLRVPGASLHYEVRGAGPVLLMVHGGSGDASGFDAVAELLASDYTIIAYDRRGLSRSKLDDPDDEMTVEMNSDDAHRLLDHLGAGPAYVFGSSGGAVVGLDLVARHPEQVRRVVAHEPPAQYLLPDAAALERHVDELIETYHRNGLGPAMRRVVTELAGVPSIDRSHADTTEQRVKNPANAVFLFEHEFPMFHKYRYDFGALQAAKSRIVIAGGTGKQFPAYRSAVAIADRLGTSVVEFPGHHGGYGSHPKEFVEKLAEVLAE